MSFRPRLGVNLDHIATLRQARGEVYPSLADGIRTAFESGADQLTLHLREDRRHIQDYDIPLASEICQEFARPFNFELGANSEIVQIAAKTRPEWVCFVPEKREERTTEGGLGLCQKHVFQSVEEAIGIVKSASPQTKVSLFLEADTKILELASKLKADAVEIHTGDYARAFLDRKDISTEVERFEKAKTTLAELSIAPHAGHGLTLSSLTPLLEKQIFHEYNIGHSIISQSIFDGLRNVIRQYLEFMEKYPVS